MIRISTNTTSSNPVQKPSLKIPSITEQEESIKAEDNIKSRVEFFILFRLLKYRYVNRMLKEKLVYCVVLLLFDTQLSTNNEDLTNVGGQFGVCD